MLVAYSSQELPFIIRTCAAVLWSCHPDGDLFTPLTDTSTAVVTPNGTVLPDDATTSLCDILRPYIRLCRTSAVFTTPLQFAGGVALWFGVVPTWGVFNLEQLDQFTQHYAQWSPAKPLLLDSYVPLERNQSSTVRRQLERYPGIVYVSEVPF